MTSIAVKLEQRIFLLEKDNVRKMPSNVNYVKHYLNYIIVRTLFRGIFMFVGKVMVRTGDIESHYQGLKSGLYVFAGVSLYLSIHAICCFDELKVFLY